MSSKPSEEVQQDQNQIRQNLVTTAINFLLNPAVVDKPYEHKTAFLRKKGLTEAEISLAYERADTESKYRQIKNSHVINNSTAIPPPVPYYRTPDSLWTRLNKYSSSIIVLGVALFGAHYIYKKYIEPLIFGGASDDRSQTLHKQLQEMIDSLSQLQIKMSEMEENVKCQKEQIDKIVNNEIDEYYPTPVALRELKTEITSVKSLMLSRHQFPALPKVTSPSIPDWQLPCKENESDTTKLDAEKSQTLHADEINMAIKPSTDSSEDSDSIEFINGKTNDDPKTESAKNENPEVLNDNLPVS